MNLKEIVTNEPFNMKWVAPINSIDSIADRTALATRKTTTKFQNNPSELVCQKTLMERFSTRPILKSSVNILHMPIPSLYWRLREELKTTDNFVKHVETNHLFSIYYDVWECDDTGELKQHMIGKRMIENYEMFNYYESLKDEEIIRKIKTLEFCKIQDRSGPFESVSYDVLSGSIILLKHKYMADYKPSFKDYAHLI